MKMKSPSKITKGASSRPGIVPSRPREGKIEGVYVLTTDITERKRAEDELRRHRQQLADLNQNLEKEIRVRLDQLRKKQEELNQERKLEAVRLAGGGGGACDQQSSRGHSGLCGSDRTGPPAIGSSPGHDGGSRSRDAPLQTPCREPADVFARAPARHGSGKSGRDRGKRAFSG